MKKALKTRYKITKNGKVLQRKKGQCHFKVNKSSKQLNRKKKYSRAPYSVERAITKNSIAL